MSNPAKAGRTEHRCSRGTAAWPLLYPHSARSLLPLLQLGVALACCWARAVAFPSHDTTLTSLSSEAGSSKETSRHRILGLTMLSAWPACPNSGVLLTTLDKDIHKPRKMSCVNCKEILEGKSGDFCLFRARFPSYYTRCFILPRFLP